MKRIIYFSCLSIFLQVQLAIAQIDYTPYPGYTTHCPGEYMTYTANGYEDNCTSFTWTITNGKIRHPQTTQEVTTLTGYSSAMIKWNDVTSIGKLKVSVTCGTSSSAVTYVEEKEFIIRSVNSVSPSGFELFNGPLPLCNSGTISAKINKIFVPGTPSGYILA